MKIRKNKKIALLCVAALVSLLGMNVFAEDLTEKSAETKFSVNVIHTNDIHARVQSNEKSQILGLERVKTLADQMEETADGLLLLDAGDYFHGQSIATIDQGESIAEVMKACGYDAMTTGNHDWNYGKEQLKKLEGIAGLSILAGNVVDNNGQQFFDNNYIVKEIEKDGQVLKIGLFGVIDPEVYTSTAPENVEGLQFTEMTAYANQVAEELEEQGCQIVIGLTHCNSPEEMAAAVNGVDLWVSGHEHKEINETVTTPDGGKALVVETGYYLWTIGNVAIDCTVDEAGEVVSLEMQENLVGYDEGSQLEPDAEISQMFADISEEQKEVLSQVVGYVSEDMEFSWEKVRTEDTKVGRAVTNAYIDETGADVAFENAGGIRAGVEAGDVTYQEVLDISPFGNYVVTKSLTGKEILSMVETSLDIMKGNIAANDAGDYDGWPDNSGSMLQMAGIKVVYDMNCDKGNRIVEAEIHGKSVENDKEYTVAMNNYMGTNTEDFPELAGKENINEFGACDEVLKAYFSQEDSVILKDIHTESLVAYEETEKPSNPSEPEVPGDEGKDNEGENNTDKNEVPKDNNAAIEEEQKDVPKTSDEANIWILLGAMIVSASVYTKMKRI